MSTQRVSFKGVLLGGIVDIVATNIVSLPVIAVALGRTNLVQLPPSERTEALMAIIKAGVALYVLLAALGALCSVLGGYVAAIIAKRNEILNGALSSYFCVGMGIVTLMLGKEQIPVWLHILLLPLSPALAGLGGYLRLVQNRYLAHRVQMSVPNGAA
jgi:hypothetical protein